MIAGMYKKKLHTVDGQIPWEPVDMVDAHYLIGVWLFEWVQDFFAKTEQNIIKWSLNFRLGGPKYSPQKKWLWIDLGRKNA